MDTRGRAATVRVDGDAIVTTPAREGEAVDTVELERRLASLPATVTVPVAPVAPAVSDADAAAARARALRLTRRPGHGDRGGPHRARHPGPAARRPCAFR